MKKVCYQWSFCLVQLVLYATPKPSDRLLNTF